MKYLVYTACAIIGFLLFVPETGTTQIRNLPILIALISFFVGFRLFRFAKYIVLMMKTKKALTQKGMRLRKVVISPFGAGLHGRYAMSFSGAKADWNILFLVVKEKYPHYFFDKVDFLEFFRRNRIVFNAGKTKGAIVSKQVETQLIGKQRLLWTRSTMTNVGSNILLMDKFPNKIFDSVKREELGNGDRICGTDTRLWNWRGFCQYIEEI